MHTRTRARAFLHGTTARSQASQARPTQHRPCCPARGVQRACNRSHAVQHDPHREHNHATEPQQARRSHTTDGMRTCCLRASGSGRDSQC
eukprot:13727110-Alexandrium_andersonii.AAC.1